MSSSGSSSITANAASSRDLRDGVLAGLFAYFSWGFLPAYFKFMQDVPPLEMVAHRVVWAVPFGLLIILIRRQWRDVLKAVRQLRTMGLLFVTSVMITINWTLYVWAVQNDQVFQGSLGYYINPLFYVLVGVVFFKDPFRRLQKYAIICATVAVVLLIVVGGRVPVIALTLALSFTTYGVIRKKVDIGGMPGLFIETVILCLPAFFYLVWLKTTGELVYHLNGPGHGFSFMLAGPVTVLPLLMFAISARRLTLSTMGFMQFIGPTIQFCLGVYYGEQLTPAYLGCFMLVWLAVALYGYDVWSNARLQRPNIRPS